MGMLLLASSLIHEYGILGVFISTILMNASILFPLPADLFVFSAGALSDSSLFFNPFAIGIVAGIGSAIGELTAWAVGWEADRLLMRKKHGKVYHRAEKIFKKYGFAGIVVFAFTPLPLDIMGLIAGALRYSPLKYFAASLIGKVPRCLLLSYAGFYGTTAVLHFFHLVF